MRQTLRILLLTAVLMIPALPSASAQALRAPSVSEEADVPKGYVLSAAYPNPFNPTTTFTLSVREAQHVRVEVFNLLGLPVKLLYSGPMEAGETKSFTFDAGDLPSGIYLYRVQGKTFTATRQVTLLK